jgi:uncharacterized membrane protein YdjX (TVP38/TMEM64 family)
MVGVILYLASGKTFGVMEAAIITSGSYLANFIVAIIILKKLTPFSISELVPGKSELMGLKDIIRQGINIFGARE